MTITLTSLLAVVLEGEFANDDEADFLLSAGLADKIVELTGCFSTTGKKDNFLIGAHICSSTSRQTSSEILNSLLSSVSTARPNSLISAIGDVEIFAAGFWTGCNEPVILAEATKVTVDERETGAGLADAERLEDVEEETFFETTIVFAREMGFEREPVRTVFPLTTLD